MNSPFSFVGAGRHRQFWRPVCLTSPRTGLRLDMLNHEQQFVISSCRTIAGCAGRIFRRPSGRKNVGRALAISVSCFAEFPQHSIFPTIIFHRNCIAVGGNADGLERFRCRTGISDYDDRDSRHVSEPARQCVIMQAFVGLLSNALIAGMLSPALSDNGLHRHWPPAPSASSGTRMALVWRIPINSAGRHGCRELRARGSK